MRRIVGILAPMALLLVGTATLAAPPSAVASWSAQPVELPAGAVEVGPAHKVTAEYNSTYLTGRLVNRTARVLETVSVGFDLFDADGVLIGTTNGGFADGSRLDPGESGWFRASVNEPGAVARWELRRSWASEAALPSNRNFTVTVTGNYVDEDGFPHVTGTVRNDNRVRESTVVVSAAYLDQAGALVSVSSIGVAMDGPLEPGAVAPFDVSPWFALDYSSVQVRAEGRSAPSPLPVIITSTGGGAVAHGGRGVIDAVAIVRGVSWVVQFAPVALLRRAQGAVAWETVQFGQTNDKGRVSFGEVMDRHADYRVVLRPSDSYAAAESPNVHRFTVGSKLGKLAPGGARNRPLYSNLKYSLLVTAFPNERGRTVVLERKTGKKWTKVGSRRTNDQGQASFLQRPTPAGTYTFRAVLKPTAFNGGATGPATKIKVGGPWVD